MIKKIDSFETSYIGSSLDLDTHKTRINEMETILISEAERRREKC